MALTVAQFETELEAVKTAIADGDKAAAYRNYALAEVTLAALSRNLKVGDQGSSIERRAALDGVKAALDKSFENSAESSTGGMAENFVSAPRGCE